MASRLDHLQRESLKKCMIQPGLFDIIPLMLSWKCNCMGSIANKQHSKNFDKEKEKARQTSKRQNVSSNKTFCFANRKVSVP